MSLIRTLNAHASLNASSGVTKVVPVKGKRAGDVASGMIECLNKMGKKPDLILYGCYTKVSEGREHRASPNAGTPKL